MPRNNSFKVFMSYSRHDELLVKPLAYLLGAAADDGIFLDINSIKPGDRWRQEIENAVRASSVFILCWCCESKKSEFVANEIRIALGSTEKRLVPVLLCSAPLPEALADRQWIDLRGRFHHSCNQDHLTYAGKAPPTRIHRRLGRVIRSHLYALVAIVVLVLTALLGRIYLSKNPQKPAYNLCHFVAGPRAGENEWVGGPPLSEGSPCEDEGGINSGVIESRHISTQWRSAQGSSAPSTTTGDGTIIVLVWLLASLVVIGIIVGISTVLGPVYESVLNRLRGEAGRIVAAAEDYFEDFS